MRFLTTKIILLVLAGFCLLATGCDGNGSSNGNGPRVEPVVQQQANGTWFARNSDGEEEVFLTREEAVDFANS